MLGALRSQIVTGFHDVDLEVWDEGGGVLLKLLRGARHEREGPVVHRDDVLYAEEPGRVGRLERAHHYLVADGQQGEVRVVDLPNQAHVAEDRSVARVVQLEATLELDDVAHRLATVDVAAVVELYARGVEGVGRRHLEAADLDRAALLYRHGVLDPLPLQIGEDLEVGDSPRAGLRRQ